MNALKRFSFALAALMLLLPPLLAADPAAGQAIAMQGTQTGAAACMACHLPDGSGVQGAPFPRLAGLDATYIERQLQAFRDGTRNDPSMSPVAKALNEAQSADVAAYFASLNTPFRDLGAADPEVMELGEQLALNGAWDRHVPSCQNCHGPGGHGVGSEFPAIAGQSPEYIVQQFMYWRNGQRSNDSLGLMAAVAKRLTEDEIAAVATYYAHIVTEEESE